MPAYKITISKTAQKQLDKLQGNIADKLIEADRTKKAGTIRASLY